VLLLLLGLFGSAVAAEEGGQVLGEGGARHYAVAAGFLGLHLQVALHVRDKAEDRSSFFQLRFHFGNRGERLGVGIVEIEDDQRRLLVGMDFNFFHQLIHGLHERDFYVELAGRIHDLGHEEQVFHKGKDAGSGVFVQRGRVYRANFILALIACVLIRTFASFELLAEAIAPAKAAATAAPVAALALMAGVLIIISLAIAMVHGAGKYAAVAVGLSVAAIGTIAGAVLFAPAKTPVAEVVAAPVRTGVRGSGRRSLRRA